MHQEVGHVDIYLVHVVQELCRCWVQNKRRFPKGDCINTDHALQVRDRPEHSTGSTFCCKQSRGSWRSSVQLAEPAVVSTHYVSNAR